VALKLETSPIPINKPYPILDLILFDEIRQLKIMIQTNGQSTNNWSSKPANAVN
jgi:hypothetical protein